MVYCSFRWIVPEESADSGHFMLLKRLEGKGVVVQNLERLRQQIQQHNNQMSQSGAAILHTVAVLPIRC